MVDHDGVADGVDAAPTGTTGELREFAGRQAHMTGTVELFEFLYHHAAGRHIDAQCQCFRGEHPVSYTHLIIASVVKTFEELGRPVPDDAELHRFIGPAIIESLRRNHVPEDELDRAVTIYRSYYADRAVFDDPNEPGNKVPGRLVNVVFPGIREQLLKLRADGYYLALASCKPEYQCVPIC